MRWEQKISNNISTISSSVKLYTSEVETYETVHPFRKFKQTYKEGYWQLPKGIDNLVNTMEKARLEKNWEVAFIDQSFIKLNIKKASKMRIKKLDILNNYKIESNLLPLNSFNGISSITILIDSL